MAEELGPVASGEEEKEEQVRPVITRRDFLIGAGAGAAVTAAIAGGVTLLRPAPSAPSAVVPAAPAAPAEGTGRAVEAGPVPGALPATMRQVKLSINGVEHDLVVDVRESLWETMTYRLGMAGANLGCDRAQCGACTVVVDGRAVNGCSVLTARLGRGQKILTVEGLATGPGVAGLHPIQRAFWQEGGFQCGICTRGFIMSTYALLSVNKNPTRDQIREALAGNICRCGEYAKVYDAVEKAAAEMRRA